MVGLSQSLLVAWPDNSTAHWQSLIFGESHPPLHRPNPPNPRCFSHALSGIQDESPTCSSTKHPLSK